MRGLERQSEAYGLAGHAASLPTDAELAVLGMSPAGPSITAGMLDHRSHVRVALTVDLSDFDALGLPLDEGIKELAMRYDDPELAKAFKKGAQMSKKPNGKDLFDLQSKYAGQYGQAWANAFADGWEIVAARY
ncbi:hypothetical protein SEA_REDWATTLEHOG_43 [Gordonia phage RedWattleHog]|uniref:Uncharacterized protein n=1 Tax=Gordonia phage Stormageddon TaxID=2656541 RepID=A0A649VTL6_9CAUD|nr:hypothetical protein KHQ86_gp040 [Gordonia phage Stormageddon]QGJ94903.1 hypothetical protein SEA_STORMAGEDDON_40 [Gordonia phage Stormageddon]QLF83547.1 hypothetical protein SEA_REDWATTLEHOG_43 [Gordonia phage RedWattleHog]